MDEGVRWLLAHDRIDEAVYVLNRVAKINNITLSIKSKEMLAKISVDKIKADEVPIISCEVFYKLNKIFFKIIIKGISMLI